MMFFFKSSPETYAQIQPAIDNAFSGEWIETGKCVNILPLELPIHDDGLCYIAIPQWMLDEVGAEIFRDWPGVTEITESEYRSAQPQPTLP